MLRELRAHRRALPALRPFLPLLARAALRRLRPPRRRRPAGEAERLLDALPRAAAILQLRPLDLETTAALAAACAARGRRLLVEAPGAAGRDEREAFEGWHRSVIRDGLLPQLEIVARADAPANTVPVVWPHGAPLRRAERAPP